MGRRGREEALLQVQGMHKLKASSTKGGKAVKEREGEKEKKNRMSFGDFAQEGARCV